MAELNVVLSNPEQGTTREQELIAQVQRGQTGLFYELVRPYERRVYAAALAILRNEADAEDVAQEAMLKALANIRQFRAEARFSTWLIQITVNEARKKNPAAQAGDWIAETLPPFDFGRIAAQSAKQVIVQKVREAERDRQYEEYKDRIGDIVNGVVKRVEFGNVIIDLAKNGVTRAEVDRVRMRARIGLEFGLDSTSELSNWFGATQLFRTPIPPEQRMEQLDKVTPERIRQVARKYFRPNRLTIALVGGANKGTVEEAKKAIRGMVLGL